MTGCTSMQCYIIVMLFLKVDIVNTADVALYKPANQSGAYCGGTGNICYDASRAVDGNNLICAQPLTPDHSPCWWMVDLGDLYTVYSVTIFNEATENPMGGDYKFLASFTIRVGSSTDINSQSTCYTFYGTVPDGGNQTFTCNPLPLVGQYVSIQKFMSSSDQLGRPDTIVLCEVTVTAIAFGDIALHQPTNQSDQFLYYDSSRAVDGNIHNCACPLAATRSTFCWWQVDLGQLYSVSSVTIFKVGDYYDCDLFGNRDFLTGFTIRVGNDPNDIESQSPCYTFYGTVPDGGNQTFTCNPLPLVGRYVSIKKFGELPDTRWNTIVLCEVIVTGTAASISTTTLTTTATTTKSTTTTTQSPQLSTTTSARQPPSGVHPSSPTYSSTVSTTPVSATPPSSPANSSVVAADSSTDNNNSQNVAAIILGVLLGLGLVAIVALVVVVVRQQQQIKLLTAKIEENETSIKEPNSYEHLHRNTPASRTAAYRPSRDGDSAYYNNRAQEVSPYEELTIKGSSESSRT